MKNISKKIRDIRMKKGYTLEELGSRINFNYSNLSKIERGVREPTLELIEKLSDFYDVPLTYFFGEEREIPEELKSLGAEWVAIIEEAKENNLTPEEIKAIIEIYAKARKQP